MKKLFLISGLLLFSVLLFAQVAETTGQDDSILFLLLGKTTPTTFFVGLLFAMIGATITLLFGAGIRDKYSDNTPRDFKLGFLIRDNLKRIILVFLCLVVAIRFYPNLFGQEINMFLALTLGLGFDGVVAVIKQFTKKTAIKKLLNHDRDKIQGK